MRSAVALMRLSSFSVCGLSSYLCSCSVVFLFFFFKQKTAYEIGLGIPAEPLFRSKAGKGLLEGTLQAGTSAVSDKLLDLVGLGGKSAADKGKDTRDYLAAAFPELNAWERAGADASSAGMVDAGFENQK